MTVPLRLKVFKGEELIATREFERDMIKIGRLSTAHLCLDDEKASRIHSILSVEGDGKLSIVDMGSVEGTYLNGKRVNKGSVDFGDEIRIGNTRILVEKPAEQTTAPVPVPAAFDATVAVTVVEKPGEARLAPVPAAAPEPMPEPVAPVAAAPAVSAPAAPQVAVQTAAPAATLAAAAALAPELPDPEPEAAPSEEPAAEPPANGADGYESMTTLGRHREFHLRNLAFGSYQPAKPEPRRPEKASDKLGLQIRYYWGDSLLQVSQYETPASVYVGSTTRCDMRLDPEQLGAAEHALVQESGGSFAVNVGDGMVGELDRDGTLSPLSAGVYDLRTTDFAWVDMNGVRAELCFAEQPKKIIVPWWQSIDYRFVNMFLLLAFVMGAFMISASTQSEADVVADDLSANKLNVVKFLIKEAERPKRNPLLDKLANMGKDMQAGEMAEKHKGEEGKMGKQGAPVNMKNRSAPKAIDINAKDLVKNSGLLKTLGSGGGGGLSTIFGQGGLGGDIKGAIGNMFGTQVGDSGGFGGLGLKGTGTGGGGMGNTIGIGGIGTKGRGGGLGGYGTGVGNLGGKKPVDVGISDSESVIQGSLDKELIRQVIRRNIGQIRFCYEQELQVKPGLAGKVAVRFVIAPNGDVQTARIAEGTTLRDERVGECISIRVRSWKFPSPKGGGSVIVTYPFVLKPAGD